MKSVGKQLEEARLARHLTPEQVSRETKIRPERLLDLESDNYANFSSPTYARGFVRTYARFLGLDEYRLIRQLDNRIPTDEGTVLNDSAVSYLPEAIESGAPAQVNRIGSYILSALATCIGLVLLYVLVENYRAGSFTSSNNGTDDLLSNTVAVPVTTERAQPVDPSQLVTPSTPLKAEPVNAPVTPAPVPRALPVDPANPPVVPPATTDTPTSAPRALPVDLNAVNPPPTPAPAPAVTTFSAAPTVPEASPAPVPVVVPQHLHLRAAQDSHVRVACTDDPDHQQVLYDDTLGAGQTIGLPGHRFVIDVDVPSAVNIIVNGMNQGPHSRSSQPETFTVETGQP